MTTESDKTVAKMVRDTKRIRKQTSIGRLEALQAEQTRWLRRSTFARNKLAGIRAEIESLCATLADAVQEKELDSLNGGILDRQAPRPLIQFLGANSPTVKRLRRTPESI